MLLLLYGIYLFVTSLYLSHGSTRLPRVSSPKLTLFFTNLKDKLIKHKYHLCIFKHFCLESIPSYIWNSQIWNFCGLFLLLSFYMDTSFISHTLLYEDNLSYHTWKMFEIRCIPFLLPVFLVWQVINLPSFNILPPFYVT